MRMSRMQGLTGKLVKKFVLTISAGSNSTIKVSRTSSPKGHASTGNLSNNAIIFEGDVLKITFGAASGYSVRAHTVNGNTFTSGNSITVTGDVSVVATAWVSSKSFTSSAKDISSYTWNTEYWSNGGSINLSDWGSITSKYTVSGMAGTCTGYVYLSQSQTSQKNAFKLSSNGTTNVSSKTGTWYFRTYLKTGQSSSGESGEITVNSITAKR